MSKYYITFDMKNVHGSPFDTEKATIIDQSDDYREILENFKMLQPETQQEARIFEYDAIPRDVFINNIFIRREFELKNKRWIRAL